MAFWGSERIRNRLRDIIVTGKPNEKKDIDCAAYQLRMGPEVFITRTGEPSESKGHTKTLLHEGQHFEIPAGQFAFLLTEEEVHIPNDTLALISIKASWKFRGLVNVSGFHVDPGYRGRLVFAVFNAGPSPVTLCRGQQLFLMWFADLNEHSPDDVKKEKGYSSVPPELANYLSGSVYSPMALKERIDENKTYVDDEIQKLRLYILGLFMAIVLALMGVVFREFFNTSGKHSYAEPSSQVAFCNSPAACNATSSRDISTAMTNGSIGWVTAPQTLVASMDTLETKASRRKAAT